MHRPNKRPRTTGIFGPSSPQSQDIDVNEARRANDLRLKSRFESIFEKYGRDFGPVGDEIDLSTGEIVINNGHLQEMESEQDVGRGLWDEFHPEDDVEPETSGPNGTTKSASRKSGDISEGDKSHLQGSDNSPGNLDQENTPQDQPVKSSWSSYNPGGSTSKVPVPDYQEQLDGRSTSTPQNRRSSTDTRDFSRPESSSSGYGFGTGQSRGSIESPWRTPDIGARFTTTLQLTTPTPKQPTLHRSLSPPDSGSIWAVPGETRRRTHKKKLRQPKPVATSRRQQASRESPDSDDPLNDYSNITPTSKTSCPNKRESDISQPNSSDYITAPSITPPGRQEGLQKETVGFTEHGTQINEIRQLELHRGASPESAGKSTPPHQTINVEDVSTVTSPVGQDQQNLQPGPLDSVEQTEKTAHLRELSDSDPELTARSVLHATSAEDHDVTSNTPVTKGRDQEEPTPSGPSNPSSLLIKTNSEALSPHEVNKIIDLRIVQRLPWRKVLKADGTPRPSPRQLKQLNHFRHSLKGNPSEYSKRWTAEEQEKLKSFQSDSEVSWDDIQGSLPHKGREELQQEWIRICFDKEPPPKNVETMGSCATPSPSTLRLSSEDSQPRSFSTPQPQSDPIDISENELITGEAEAQRPESPDPLSVALESSLTGSGLSTMQIDTPPKNIRKKWSRHSLSKGSVSPLTKRSNSKLT